MVTFEVVMERWNGHPFGLLEASNVSKSAPKSGQEAREMPSRLRTVLNGDMARGCSEAKVDLSNLARHIARFVSDHRCFFSPCRGLLGFLSL